MQVSTTSKINRIPIILCKMYASLFYSDKFVRGQKEHNIKHQSGMYLVTTSEKSN